MKQLPLFWGRLQFAIKVFLFIVILVLGAAMPWGDLVLNANKQKQLWQASLEEGSFNTGGVKTRYLYSSNIKYKTAPLVVFFSGFGDDRYSFIKVAELLSDSTQVLLPDIPGFTAESFRDNVDYSQNYFRDHFVRLLETWPNRKLILVGKSIGGQIALNLAAVLRDRVMGIVLVAPTGINEQQSLPFSLALKKTSTPIEYKDYLNSIFYKAPSVPDFIVKSLIQERQSKQVFLEGVLRQILADKNLYVESIVNLIKAPILLFWGKEDQIVPASMAKKWEKRWPSIKTIELEDCGHVPHYEKPQIIADQIKGLLNQSVQ